MKLLNRGTRLYYLLLFNAIFWYIPLFAQSSFDRQLNYSINDGLSSNKITALLQDSKGFIWIGTEDGLCRFDGTRFVTYRHKPNDSLSISDNYIQTILESKDGNLWIGTRNGGLNRWNRSENDFTVYLANQKVLNRLPENDICGLLESADGILWIKSRHFLVRFNVESNQMESFGHYANVFKYDNRAQYPIKLGKNQKIWVGTKDGLNQFDIATKTFTRIGQEVGGISPFQESIWDLVAIDDHSTCVSTAAGLKILDETTGSLTDFQPIGEDGCSVRNVDRVMKMSKNQIVSGNFGRLITIDRTGNRLNTLVQLSYRGQMINDQITVLMEDASGIIWAGTKHWGLYKLDSRPTRFQSITTNSFPGLHDGVSNVLSLYLDKVNQLWIGKAGKGLLIYDRTNTQITPVVLNQQLFDVDEDMVYSIFCDSRSTIWIGTNHGIYNFNDESGKIEEFDYAKNTEIANLLRNNDVKVIQEDKNHHIWFGTRFGLYKYDGTQIKSFFSEAGKAATLCDDDINCLAFDESGVMWVGTNMGLNSINVDTDKIVRVDDFMAPLKNSENTSILTLLTDGIGNLWIGSRIGLVQYNVNTKSGKRFSMAQGLSSDIIKAVTIDNLDRIWVSTTKGISCIINGVVLNFGVDEGLAGLIFNQNAVCRSVNGELFFGGYEGVSFLSPGILKTNTTVPKVAITDVKIFDKGQLISQNLGERNELLVKYLKSGTIRIEFAALEYSQPHNNKYKVFLEGFDDDWSTVMSDNYVTYSNLPPGDYVFKVVGSNNDLLWNPQPVEMAITIDPPLWRSNYAVVFYLLALFFIIQGIVNYRVRYYRKAYQSLREKAFDKKKIEAQKEALSRINKSLTDSINYAKRIQEAMLLSEELVKRLINDSFIYYRPKDIVSGDFYYFYPNNNKLFVAAVDCTGHGVPGAFMSIIGYDLMRNVIEVQGVECPAVILNSMNRQLLDTFKKDVNPTAIRNLDVNDGMDMSLCVIDFEKRVVEFAGANNSLYLIRDNEIETYEGNRFAVGLTESYGKFTKQEISLRDNDVLYLFSDGYVDQFGGPEGKKYKYRRFRHMLLNIHKLPFEDQKAILHQKMEEWMGETYEQVDDMLLIGLKPLDTE